MKRIPNPANGRKFNAAHPPREDDKVSVAESHEEHLTTAFPSIAPQLGRIKELDLPASFQTIPGHVTGMKLVQLGVLGLCGDCGGFVDSPNPRCKDHPTKEASV